jgi:hypothetical protein
MPSIDAEDRPNLPCIVPYQDMPIRPRKLSLTEQEAGQSLIIAAKEPSSSDTDKGIEFICC